MQITIIEEEQNMNIYLFYKRVSLGTHLGQREAYNKSHKKC